MFEDEDQLFDSFVSQGWTDGLPVVPPTEERVRAMLLGARWYSPSDIVAVEPVKGRAITVEHVAINAVMAGCLPEYLPVVIASFEAMCEPEFNLHAVTVSTMGSAVLTVVNGPIVERVGLNSGVSVFGPGNRAVIGIRAVSIFRGTDCSDGRRATLRGSFPTSLATPLPWTSR